MVRGFVFFPVPCQAQSLFALGFCVSAEYLAAFEQQNAERIQCQTFPSHRGFVPCGNVAAILCSMLECSSCQCGGRVSKLYVFHFSFFKSSERSSADNSISDGGRSPDPILLRGPV